MNKEDLVKLVSEKTGITQKAAEQAQKVIIEGISATLDLLSSPLESQKMTFLKILSDHRRICGTFLSLSAIQWLRVISYAAAGGESWNILRESKAIRLSIFP